MQLDYMKTHLQQPAAHALVVEYISWLCGFWLLLWGSTWPSSTVLYPTDPLWDGKDCRRLEHACCDPPNLPWFCKELPQSTTDNLEFRICGNQPLADEDTPIDLVQLYIQMSNKILHGESEDMSKLWWYCNEPSFGEMILCDNEKCTIKWNHFDYLRIRCPSKAKCYCPSCCKLSKFCKKKKPLLYHVV